MVVSDTHWTGGSKEKEMSDTSKRKEPRGYDQMSVLDWESPVLAQKVSVPETLLIVWFSS
jgi:hypothetical protein